MQDDMTQSRSSYPLTTPVSATAESTTLNTEKRLRIRFALCFSLLVVALTPGSASAFQSGNIIVSVGNGSLDEFTSNGSFVRALHSGTSATYTAGSAFNSSGDLFVTEFSNQSVTRFNPLGQPAGLFGSGYNADPESITFNTLGDAYVGQADGSGEVLEFDPVGRLLNKFAPSREDRGTDWVNLAPDNCTLYYTSEGKGIGRFNVCAKAQLSPFATNLPGGAAYQVQLLPGGEVLVADSEYVLRLSAQGQILQRYQAPGDSEFFGVAPSADGTSFWAGDIGTGNLVKFALHSGGILRQFNAHPATAIGGLTLAGPAQTPTCTDAAFIAATGSGQYFQGASNLQISPQLQYLYENITQNSGGITPEVQVLNYPADSVGALTRNLANIPAQDVFLGPDAVAYYEYHTLQNNLTTYLAGKDQGLVQLRSAFASIRANCPNEHVILAGYSQGAMVVHEFLNELAKFGNTNSKNALLGAVLVADPERVKNSAVPRKGTAPSSGFGVCDLISVAHCASPAPLSDIEPAVRAKTISVCTYDDPVCDTSDLVRDVVHRAVTGHVTDAGVLVKNAGLIHSLYSSATGTREAGQTVGSWLKAAG